MFLALSLIVLALGVAAGLAVTLTAPGRLVGQALALAVTGSGATLAPSGRRHRAAGGFYVGRVPGTFAAVPRRSPFALARALLAVRRLHPGALVGVWVNGASVEVDPSAWVPELLDALDRAAAARQVAVWDVAAGCAVPVPGRVTRRELHRLASAACENHRRGGAAAPIVLGEGAGKRRVHVTDVNRATAIGRVLAEAHRGRELAEAGARWYDRAGSALVRSAVAAGREALAGAVVAAVTSPRAAIGSNLVTALSLLAGVPVPAGVTVLGARVESGARWVDGDVDLAEALGGPKVRSFACNLAGCRECVTVDVWAARVALGTLEPVAFSSRCRCGYDLVASVYRDAAAVLGVPASILQAWVWVAVRARVDRECPGTTPALAAANLAVSARESRLEAAVLALSSSLRPGELATRLGELAPVLATGAGRRASATL